MKLKFYLVLFVLPLILLLFLACADCNVGGYSYVANPVFDQPAGADDRMAYSQGN